MCGRYTINWTNDDPRIKHIVAVMTEKFHIRFTTEEIFPSDQAPVIHLDPLNNKRTVITPMFWGYETSLKKGLIINARSETVMDKPIFRDDFCYRRCLIPASGFYEWDTAKQRYLFYSDDLLYFGGIYKFFNGIYRYVILTKPSNELVAEIHDRMPVIITNEMIPAWFLNHKAAYEQTKNNSLNLKMKLIDPFESFKQLSFTFEDR